MVREINRWVKLQLILHFFFLCPCCTITLSCKTDIRGSALISVVDATTVQIIILSFNFNLKNTTAVSDFRKYHPQSQTRWPFDLQWLPVSYKQNKQKIYWYESEQCFFFFITVFTFSNCKSSLYNTFWNYILVCASQSSSITFSLYHHHYWWLAWMHTRDWSWIPPGMGFATINSSLQCRW